MDENFIRNRITQLRLKKQVSEYKMSLDLGHSKSYIQSISSGRSLPSMPEFLYICEYFQITPEAFFEEDVEFPAQLRALLSTAKKLPEKDLQLLIDIAARLSV
ncbi:MAG: helix-turn-helix transcriptional regulator [Ruminococcaceae bacterium]|nr:helix-turn-helix transcriptional regulator [Oscillospiraceae bacterium]